MKLDNRSLKDLRTVAAPLLALAVKELCPKARLVGGGPTHLGFYYDFQVPYTLHSSFSQDVEERMYAISAKKAPISYLEMVPSCAEGCLLAEKEPLLARAAGESPSATVSLIEIFGKRLPVKNIVAVENTEELQAIKVLKFEVRGEYVRFHGTVFSDKYSLKTFLKKKRDWIGKPHWKNNECFLELSKGGVAFLPKGREKLAFLLQKVEECLVQEKGLVHLPEGSISREKEHGELFEVAGIQFVSETLEVEVEGEKTPFGGVFGSSLSTGNVSHIFSQESLVVQEAISFLHFMTKIFKILGFEFEPVLLGKRGRGFAILQKALDSVGEYSAWTAEQSDGEVKIEWRVQDYMGKMWPIASLGAPRKVKKKAGFLCFPCSVVSSFERLAALFVEKGSA